MYVVPVTYARRGTYTVGDIRDPIHELHSKPLFVSVSELEVGAITVDTRDFITCISAFQSSVVPSMKSD